MAKSNFILMASNPTLCMKVKKLEILGESTNDQHRYIDKESW